MLAGHCPATAASGAKVNAAAMAIPRQTDRLMGLVKDVMTLSWLLYWASMLAAAADSTAVTSQGWPGESHD
jgi:hypothetical protein